MCSSKSATWSLERRAQSSLLPGYGPTCYSTLRNRSERLPERKTENISKFKIGFLLETQRLPFQAKGFETVAFVTHRVSADSLSFMKDIARAVYREQKQSS